MSGVLWQLPSVTLKRVARGWHVRSERGWGEAMALFAPLRRVGSDWELAAPESCVFDLTAIDDDQWRPVPLPAAPAASHYLCLLRYDQPLQRPERRVARDRFLPPRHVPVRSEEPHAQGTHVHGHQLRAVLAQVRADAGQRFANYLVTAPTPPMRSDSVPDTLCFAFASCQYPAGMLDRTIAHASWRALAAHVAADPQHAPERILLVGDQVYVDATYGLLDPLRPDDSFRLAYEEFADRENGPFAQLPQDLIDRMRLMPDDHEIIDNWEPEGGPDTRLELALDAFWEVQRLGDRRRAAVQLRDHGPSWRLYMADSRTQRDRRDTGNVGSATLLGERQTCQLERWLHRMPADELKIVTTAAMLLPRTRSNLDEPLYLDNWQGYPASLHRLLAFLCEHETQNVVFLSGDAHLACSARITVTSEQGRSVRFQSHHAPALYAPFPFANESRWNLLLHDTFTFTHAGRGYRCSVEGEILADGRNGCGWLEATRIGAQWQVHARVIGEEAARRAPPPQPFPRGEGSRETPGRAEC